MAMPCVHAEVLAALPEAVLVTSTDGTLRYVNPAFTRLTGYAWEDLVGQTPRVLRSGRTDPAVHAELWREILAGRSWQGRLVNRRKDGSEYWAELTVAPLDLPGGGCRFVATQRDVTELHERERRLARSERSLRALIEQLPHALAVARDDRIVYANSACARLLGQPEVLAVVGLHVADLFRAPDRTTITQRIRELAARSGPEEKTFLRADGTTGTAEVAAVPIAFDGLPAVLLAAQDVTEHREMMASMMRMDRMIAVGTLAAGVAHEINNPLAYVAANIEFARREIDALAASEAQGAGAARLEDVTAALAEANDGAARISTIVRDLRTFSRADEDERYSVELERVLDSSIALAWNEIKHRARLIKHYDPAPPVLATESRLGQVFLNLLVNAAQAIPEGQAARNEIRVSIARAPDGGAMVEVADTGAGILPDVRARIFDPFFTTKPIGQGTGLGLSICQNIVTALGGRLSLESEPGSGTTVRVWLPAARVRTAPPRRSEPPPHSAIRLRVLVVDDEPLIGRAVRRILQDEHEVEVVSSAAEAVERLRAGTSYSAILCDLMMPEISGMELHGMLAKNWPDQARRMIFVTGGAFTPWAREFLERVPNHRVDKPIDRQTLRRLVQDPIAPALAADRSRNGCVRP